MRWLPPKKHTIDLVLTVVIAAIFGGYFKYTDSQRFEELKVSQQEMNKLFHDKSEPAIAAGLLSFLTCTNSPEIRKSAIALLGRAAPEDADRRMQSAINACGLGPLPNTSFQESEGTFANRANEPIFTTEVKYGRDFYKDRLWKQAAEQWYRAMSDLPQTYIDNRKIDWNEISAARGAYEDENYLTAADS
jgi:hypothetical protein